MSENSVTPQSASAMSQVLGRIPSGVFILVAGNAAGAKTGLMASWIQQASFAPPQVTVAVNKSRYLNSWLVPGAAVTLNQIAKGDNSLFRHYGKGFDPEGDAFQGLDVVPARNGLPLLRVAMCSLEGYVSGHMESGDHILYLVTLTEAHCHRDVSEFDPFVHIRKNGFSY